MNYEEGIKEAYDRGYKSGFKKGYIEGMTSVDLLIWKEINKLAKDRMDEAMDILERVSRG